MMAEAGTTVPMSLASCAGVMAASIAAYAGVRARLGTGRLEVIIDHEVRTRDFQIGAIEIIKVFQFQAQAPPTQLST